jgi:hypothetical protein
MSLEKPVLVHARYFDGQCVSVVRHSHTEAATDHRSCLPRCCFVCCAGPDSGSVKLPDCLSINRLDAS